MDFYDSTRPELIPAGAHACLYFDGDYSAVDSREVSDHKFPAVRWITVLGDFTHCGIADFEAGNEVFSKPGALRQFVQGRTGAGHRARVYCDRANLPEVRALLGGLDYLVWVATLDGDRLSPGFTPGLWAVQYLGGPRAGYDTSVLYGTW